MGEIYHVSNRWDFPPYIPTQFGDAASVETAKLKGYISNVTGGVTWRDKLSRIRAKLDWALPHQALGAFMEASKFGDLEYVCLDSTISNDPEEPSIFEVLGNFRLEAGQTVYNALQWTSQVMQIPLEATILCQATGFLQGDIFAGIASSGKSCERRQFPTRFK